jgi:hypothetical protein
VSLVRSTQALPHREKLGSQLKSQPPLTHLGVACAGVGQTFPQVPQLLGSLLVFVQYPLQQLAGKQHCPPQLTSKREEQHSPFLQFSGKQHWSPHLACHTQYCVTK